MPDELLVWAVMPTFLGGSIAYTVLFTSLLRTRTVRKSLQSYDDILEAAVYVALICIACVLFLEGWLIRLLGGPIGDDLVFAGTVVGAIVLAMSAVYRVRFKRGKKPEANLQRALIAGAVIGNIVIQTIHGVVVFLWWVGGSA